MGLLSLRHHCSPGLADLDSQIRRVLPFQLEVLELDVLMVVSEVSPAEERPPLLLFLLAVEG